MKKLFLPFLAVFALGFVTSCSDDDPVDPIEEGEEMVKSGSITANETWTAENVYILDGKVVVDAGVTLTIEAGTIIKGEEGQGDQASALVVAQGGKLMANGTADAPIVFTSVLDDIQPGQKAGTNLDIEDKGAWGGVIILGRAPISVASDLQTKNVEGLPANAAYSIYGGTDAADNSGSIKYISIRHGGVAIATDNEINGLTLAGVGSGTVIQNVEIVGNQDDGIEWFGGTVNVTNLLTYGQGDDGFDVDMAYSGTISNGLVVQGPEPGSAFELDGPEGTAATEASFTMEDITVIGGGQSAMVADLRDGVLCALNNILVYDITATSTINVAGADSQTEFANDRITFSNWEVVLPTGVALPALLTGAPAGTAANFTGNVATIASADAATVGADLAAFSWTYAASKSAF
ncbi:hypothetical protein [Parapedobacter sp. DT-150]|uniref:hypothetical protein n=1 Tax=Parapedobacter sp. DT-150 TaxID=3396162 RepID=UPI003F1D87EB